MAERVFTRPLPEAAMAALPVNLAEAADGHVRSLLSHVVAWAPRHGDTDCYRIRCQLFERIVRGRTVATALDRLRR